MCAHSSGVFTRPNHPACARIRTQVSLVQYCEYPGGDTSQEVLYTSDFITYDAALGMNIVTIPADLRGVTSTSPDIAGAEYTELANTLTVAGSYSLYVEAHSVQEPVKCFGAEAAGFVQVTTGTMRALTNVGRAPVA
eukprot:8159471-Pyramimonas_sp.AAC.2